MNPISLENFKTYHDKYYQRILNSIPNKQILLEIEGFFREIVKTGDFCIRVPLEKLEAIINDNCLKSQIELKEGATIGGPEVRIEATRQLFDSNIKNMNDCDYPKYGYIGPKEKIQDYIANSDFSYQYGDVILTLKKENLLQRTTLSVGSTINFGASQFICPTPVANPKACCIKAVNHNEKEPINMQKLIPYAYFFYAIMNKELTVENFYNIQDIFKGAPGFEFFELQFHGDIIIDRDVEHIYILSSKEETKRYNTLIENIKLKGIRLETRESLF